MNNIQLILTRLFREMSAKEELHGYVKQGNVVADTADFSVTAIEETFGELLITRGPWPPKSSDFNPRHYLQGTVTDNKKDSLCMQQNEDNIQRQNVNISGQRFRTTSRSTVEPALYDTSPIDSNIMWYQLIPHC
jgi:hypothetical protein